MSQLQDLFIKIHGSMTALPHHVALTQETSCDILPFFSKSQIESKKQKSRLDLASAQHESGGLGRLF